MNRYHFDCDAEYEMAVSRFSPPVAATPAAPAVDTYFDDYEDYSNCKCGTRNWKHCLEHAL